MRITEINRSRVVSAMVRGYFHAFFSGQSDALFPGKKKLDPKEYKQLLVSNFDHLSSHFVSVLFPVLIRLNNSNLNAVADDMKRRHFSGSTPSKVLLRYACSSKELYDQVSTEYQRQVYSLLDGHLQTADEYFADCSELLAEDHVTVPLAIRSVVRVQMQAYALGIMQAQSEVTTLHQATVYRLMLSGMMALLHEKPVIFEGDNLEMMFRQVSLNSDNFEMLMDEMNQAYEDLV
ncbi:MAG: hypothetical protein K6A82_05675 [Prevotella sp.]|nr:hypothetical protein [Prevotella sp.]